MRMVDRMPDALSGAMGNQMYVATVSTREGKMCIRDRISGSGLDAENCSPEIRA